LGVGSAAICCTMSTLSFPKSPTNSAQSAPTAASAAASAALHWSCTSPTTARRSEAAAGWAAVAAAAPGAPGRGEGGGERGSGRGMAAAAGCPGPGCGRRRRRRRDRRPCTPPVGVCATQAADARTAALCHCSHLQQACTGHGFCSACADAALHPTPQQSGRAARFDRHGIIGYGAFVVYGINAGPGRVSRLGGNHGHRAGSHSGRVKSWL